MFHQTYYFGVVVILHTTLLCSCIFLHLLMCKIWPLIIKIFQCLSRCSHGVLCDTEQRDMRLVVKRLARIASVIRQPHLVERRPDTHSVRLPDLHRHLIGWFITHNLPQLLWFYIDYWQWVTTSQHVIGSRLTGRTRVCVCGSCRFKG